MNTLKKIPLFLLLTILFAPLLFLAEAWFLPSDKAWYFFLEEELYDTIIDTLVFSLGTVFVSAVFGITAAYITVFFNYPGKSFFQWALILPLAFPAYILGFTYLGLFEPTGIFQEFLKGLGLPIQLPGIKNMFGAIIFKSLTLYPYIYLLTKTAFSTQSNRLIESATLLGCHQSKLIFKVLIPLAWPWIFSGMLLVFMEALADFGMVKLFNIDTFTTVIYSKWGGEQSFVSASRISFFLLIFLVVFFLIQNHLKGFRKVFASTKEGLNYYQMKEPRFFIKAISFLLMFFLFIFSFLLPVVLLAWWALKNYSSNDWRFWASFFNSAGNSFVLSLGAAVMITLIAIVFSLYERNLKSKIISSLIKLSTMGYALPGTLLGICVFSFLNFLDVKFNINILSSSLLALMIGYFIRFNAVAYQNVSSAYERVSPTLDESGYLFGKNAIQVFKSIHLPLIKTGLFSSIILVFVDIMKELPLTLIMRPLGGDVLSIKIYNYTAEGEWARASFPALLLILVGVLPILILTKFSSFHFNRVKHEQ